MPVKVSYAGLKKKDKLLTEFISKAVDKALVKEILQLASDNIRIRTTKGRGVNKNKGPEGSFADLKDSTIKARKRKKKKGLLAQGVGPAKARLTETGEMLKSLTYKINRLDFLRRAIRSVSFGTLYFKGTHKGGISNARLAEIHDTGEGKMTKRPFFKVSGKEYKILSRTLSRRMRDKLRALRNKLK